MNLDDDRLKRIYRAHVAGQRPPDRRTCPSVEELARFFDPAAPRRRKRRIVDHITRCAPCHREFETLLEIERKRKALVGEIERVEAGAGGSQAPAKRPFWRARTLRFAVVLLVIASAVAIYLQIVRSTLPKQIYRGPEDAVRALRPIGDCRRATASPFIWEDASGAGSYVVEIFDSELELLWVSPRLPVRALVLPPEVLAKIAPGQPHFWTVSAYRDGEKTGEASLVEFRLID